MVANTEIKFYVHSNNNIPQLNNSYGNMIDVLDACLVNGITIGTVSSLTIKDKIATLKFSTFHNLKSYQVIRITGANQSWLNKEHRVVNILDQLTITFEVEDDLNIEVSVDKIYCTLPALGWKKPFSQINSNGGGKAAYRSANEKNVKRPYLRVVDEFDDCYTATYAKYAKVGLVEEMSSIDDMRGVQAPFDATNPYKNWIGTGSGTEAYNGWAKWYYSRVRNPTVANYYDSEGTTTGNKIWLIVGTSDYFYILPSVTLDTIANLYFFGQFKSFIDGDQYNALLGATLLYQTAPLCRATIDSTSGTNASTKTLLLQRTFDSVPNYINGGVTALSLSADTPRSGIKSMNVMSFEETGDLLLGRVFILESSTLNSNSVRIVRGELPALQWILQKATMANHQTLEDNQNFYIFRDVAVINDSSSSYTGQVAFKLTE